MIPFIKIGSIQIASFFAVISLSLTVLLFYLSKRVELFKRDRKIAFDIAIVLMIAGFFGGRMMHVFYEEWPFYKANPMQILYFWQGGFVFLGGLISCSIFGAIYTYYKKINFLEWADFFSPIFSLSHALGRIGCFLSGCCYGNYCNLPWAVSGRHPTVLYLFFGELAIFLILLFAEKKQVTKGAGQLFFLWLMLHSTLRFFVEYFRNDFRGVFFNVPAFGSLSISQFLCLIIIITSMVFFASQSENSSSSKK